MTSQCVFIQGLGSRPCSVGDDPGALEGLVPLVPNAETTGYQEEGQYGDLWH